jgi:cytochrome c oxidase subunit 2
MDSWLRKWMLPPVGSQFAREVDDLYMFLVWLSVFFFLVLAVPIFISVFKWHYKPGRKTPHITHHLGLELTWSIIPLIIVIGIFFWGLDGYMKFVVAPGEALEINVIAKKWLWQFEYPDGTRTINKIHVPLGKTVRFVMTSEDVLHSFFIPNMRVKHDVVPGRYTEVWFKPEAEGKDVITCAEYCGKGHSDMHGEITIDNDAAYKKWRETGGDEWKCYFGEATEEPCAVKGTPAEWGKIQWEQKGCQTCHSVDGTRGQGPTWKGIWNKQERLADGKTALVDENYLRESMLNPNLKVVAGFEPIMPTFQGLLRENEIRGLIAFIKSLQ